MTQIPNDWRALASTLDKAMELFCNYSKVNQSLKIGTGFRTSIIYKHIM